MTVAQDIGSKGDIQAFWKSLYHSLYDDMESGLTRDALLKGLDALEDMFRFRRHMAVEEMPLAALNGKRVLEIGPGAGGHSALFAKHGAVMTSLDITFDRARSVERKFRLMGELADGCTGLQGDAESLPFADGTFDIVYSNGVLHHTADTQKAVDEVLRVLKPGGQAVIMLYCKSSWHYWFNMLFCVGLLQGQAFRSRNWLGHATEWGGRNRQTVANPYTRCYTRGGLASLFARFAGLKMRKHEFYFYLIPKLGRLYRAWQVKRYGTHPGGILVYGEPWPVWSPLEAWLGPRIGWVWYISGFKPTEGA